MLRERGGLGILVSEGMVGREMTSATYKLRSPKEVLKLLRRPASAGCPAWQLHVTYDTLLETGVAAEAISFIYFYDSTVMQANGLAALEELDQLPPRNRNSDPTGGSASAAEARPRLRIPQSTHRPTRRRATRNRGIS